MPQINQEAVIAIQPELTSGETIAWASQPKAGVILHKEDWYLIPFSVLWGGFALFWESGVARFGGSTKGAAAPLLFQLWGIPFVLIGQYLIWGRFFYMAWLRRRTYYAATNRRLIVLQKGWKRQMASCYIDSVPTLIKEGGSNGTGVLRFAPAQPIWSGRQGWGAWNALSVGVIPAFIDIEDVDAVYRLISDLREKARTAPSAR
jgi:hypothetical protein